MIPIKGYATFDPLKHCLVGQNFSSDFFKNVIKEPKISGPLQRIADETEEDYLKLEKILKDAGVKTYRPGFKENNYNKDVFDHFKRHKVEPIIFNFRHRYFWDGGVHCITQDLYREGTQVD